MTIARRFAPVVAVAAARCRRGPDFADFALGQVGQIRLVPNARATRARNYSTEEVQVILSTKVACKRFQIRCSPLTNEHRRKIFLRLWDL